MSNQEITDNLLCLACMKTSEEKSPNLGNFNTKIIKVENDTAVIYYTEKYLIVSFANSNDVQDWIGNFIFSKKKTVYGGIHTDFWESYEKLFKKIIETMHTLNFYDKDIYITGHSRGGALAVLFALDNPYNMNVKKLTTFGCPKVGDKKFKESFINRVKFEVNRYVNYLDVVPTIPIWGYSQPVLGIYFDKDGKIPKKRPRNYLFLIRKIRGILHHDLEDYYENTRKNNL
jgi:predicted lipase